MSNKYPTLADYKDSRLLQKSYEQDEIFKSKGPWKKGTKFHVYRKGGSIGEIDKKNYHPKYGFKVRTFEEENEAREYVKRMNKTLSPGEKSYYGLKYHLKPEQIKEEFNREEYQKDTDDEDEKYERTLEKSAHKQHKYLEIKDGKYIYDYSKMTSKDHFDAAEYHNNRADAGGNEKTKEGRNKALEYHKRLSKEHENLAYKKEVEERKKIKEEDYSGWTAQQHKDEATKNKKFAQEKYARGDKQYRSEDSDRMYKEAQEHDHIAQKHENFAKQKEEKQEKISKSEAFDILIPVYFDDRIEKSKGPWKKGKNRATVYSKHKNKEVKNLDEYLDNEEINSIIKESEKIDWNDKDLDVSDITDKIQYSKYVNEILSKLKDKKLIEQDDDGWDWIDQNTGKRIS